MDLLNKEDKRFELLRGLTHLTVFKTVPFSQTWVILHKLLIHNVTSIVNPMDLVGLEPTTGRL